MKRTFYERKTNELRTHFCFNCANLLLCTLITKYRKRMIRSFTIMVWLFLLWRQMMREHTAAAKKFYNSKAWRKCRESYIQMVPDGLCEHCQFNPGYIVDHKEEINIYNINDSMITLNHDNLQYLCLECQ